MKRFLFASLAVAALSVAGVLCWWLWHVGHESQTTVASYQHVAAGAVTTEKAATVALQESAETLKTAREALKAARATIASYEGRSQAWEALAQRETAALRGQLVYAQIMEVRPVRDALVSAIDGHAKLADELRPAVADARKLLVSTDDLVVKATPGTLGLIGGWKQLGGFSAQTVRDVRTDVKTTIGNVATTSTEVARVAPQATTDAAATLHNVRRATGWPSLVFGAIKKVGCRIPPVSFVPGCD